MLSSSGEGDVKVNIDGQIRTISRVTLVPEISASLLSVSQMVKNGLTVTFDSSGCRIFLQEECSVKGQPVARGSECGGVYKLDCSRPTVEPALAVTHHDSSYTLWHKRLGHVNPKSMCLLRDGLADGVNFKNIDADSCVSCLKGKLNRSPFPRSENRATQRLALIHSDLCGPMSEESFGGGRYMMIFVDDYTRKIFVYILRYKNQAFSTFLKVKALLENETNSKIKVLRTDNGTEYVNSEFSDFLEKSGIRHEVTIPHTPEQNGVAERANRTICEMARSMLLESDLPKPFWAEACSTAVYLKNRQPHRSLDGAIPEQLWTGKKIDLSHLRVFGCTAFAHIPKQFRKKFDAKSQQLIFVGYCLRSKGYRLLDLKNPKRIIRARDVSFIENGFCPGVNSSTSDELQLTVTPASSVLEEESSGPSSASEEEETISDRSSNYSTPEGEEDEETGAELEEGVVRYPQRDRKPREFPGFVLYQAMINEENFDPRTYKDVLSSANKDEWMLAMKEEMSSLLENEVWELTDRPPDAKIVDCKWVYKTKIDTDGKIRYKARLVAKGFSQHYGIDYFETFSPVVRRSSIRLLLSLAAQMDLKIVHFDVQTAFLHGELQETVFMKQPEGFSSADSKDQVCRLKKAIYGLKQSSRTWNMKVNDVLIKNGYESLKNEACIYMKRKGPSLILIALYVDDFYVFHNDEKEKNDLFLTLERFFKIKDLGEARSCLGMRIRRSEDGTLFLDQAQYIDAVLQRFHMSECKPVATPLETKLKDDSEELPKTLESSLPYQNLVGCLMYLAVNTRPDIAHAASFLSQYNTCYTVTHWKWAKRVLRYLKGTSNFCLVYRKGCNLKLTGFVDSDWAGNPRDRKSTTGYAFELGGGLISWESKKQPTVALSSTEAEYMGLTEGSKEAIHLQRLLSEIMKSDGQPIVIYNDNQSALKLSMNHMFHNRTKHIDIKHHFVRECIENAQVILEYMPTNKMPADMLTKSLCQVKHYACMEGLGMYKYP
uniref:Retrovirus-related Pol polyprotein from transposon TNT 1-94 n=3 Tax=Lygus hesperus TaxID=30085 RepID=A0A146LH62_LYGHE